MLNIPFGFFGENEPLFLSLYPGATVAHSVRLLDRIYAGNCMRIRKDSNGAELDIGFDSTGYLDTAAIVSHAAGGLATVTTWYDQTGNGNHAVQTTTTLQPYITNTSGAIQNGPTKAILNFNDSTNQGNTLTYPTPILYGNASSFFPVTGVAVAADSYIFGGLNGVGSRPAYLSNFSTGDFEWYDEQQIVINATGGSNTNVQQVSTCITQGSTITSYYQGAQAFSQAALTNTATRDLDTIGGSGATSDRYRGVMSEFIIYTTIDKSTDQAAMTADQVAYF